MGPKKTILFLILVFFFSLLQECLGDNGSYFKGALSWGGVDLQLIQKVLFCVAFTALLYRLDFSTPRFIEELSKTSFSIYFLHPFFIIFFLSYVEWSRLSVLIVWLFFPVSLLFVIVVSIGFAKAVKFAFSGRSRCITGY